MILCSKLTASYGVSACVVVSEVCIKDILDGPAFALAFAFAPALALVLALAVALAFPLALAATLALALAFAFALALARLLSSGDSGSVMLLKPCDLSWQSVSQHGCFPGPCSPLPVARHAGLFGYGVVDREAQRADRRGG